MRSTRSPEGTGRYVCGKDSLDRRARASSPYRVPLNLAHTTLYALAIHVSRSSRSNRRAVGKWDAVALLSKLAGPEAGGALDASAAESCVL